MNIYFNAIALAATLLLMGMEIDDFVLLPEPDSKMAPESPNKTGSKRVPNLTTELEFSFSELNHYCLTYYCSPKLLGYLVKKIESNRAFANFSHDELQLLLGSRFGRVALSNPIVLRAFWKFIDPPSNPDNMNPDNINPDGIQAWLASNPLLGPDERRFLIIALLIYEREAAADLAKMGTTLWRAREELGSTDPESVKEIHSEHERLTNDWEFVALLLANIIGFPSDFDRITRIMASELYRDRVGNIEIAMIIDDWASVRTIILSAIKNNIVMNESKYLKKLANKIKKIDISLAGPGEISIIKELSNKILSDTRYQIAHQLIPKLMESDAGDNFSEPIKNNLMIRLKGAYLGHYFKESDLRNLKVQFQDNEKLLKTLGQLSFDEKDRARVRFYLLQQLKQAHTEEMRNKIIIRIFRLYAPPRLKIRTTEKQQ